MKPSPDEIRSIYAGIEGVIGLEVDIRGWNHENPNFEEAIKSVAPTVIIEAGSYLGASVIHMLTVAKRRGLYPLVYSVDAWHGPNGHPIGHLPESQIPASFNRPTQYQQFLRNIKSRGFDSQVIPIQAFTAWGAEILKAWGVKAQVCYLDGDHSYNGCLADLRSYWPLVEIGGRVIGDDLHYAGGGVWRAVGEFASEIDHDVRSESGQFIIDKRS